jgi:adenine deaminase
VIANGAPMLHAYRAATWSAAQAFGLRDRGLIAPGRRADIVLVERPRRVPRAAGDLGRADRDARAVRGARRRPVPPVGLDSVKLRPVTAATFHMPAAEPWRAAGDRRPAGLRS